VNGAGGVGTAAIQLARKVFGIKTIIATASRPETIDWVKKLGATHVIDHHKELGPQLKDLGLQPSLAFDCRDAATYVPALVPLMRAFGRIGSIVSKPYTLSPEITQTAFVRSLGIHYEFMFARSMWGHDMSRQGEILDQVAELAARGELSAGVTRRERLGVKTLREGHELQESNKSYGKIAFEVPDTLDEE
jgi:NADPH:quinone reductase-like Zn-dependent oxidoreductase